jgi:hypothetical protein
MAKGEPASPPPRPKGATPCPATHWPNGAPHTGHPTALRTPHRGLWPPPPSLATYWPLTGHPGGPPTGQREGAGVSRAKGRMATGARAHRLPFGDPYPHRLTGGPPTGYPTFPTDLLRPTGLLPHTGRLRFTANCKVNRYFSALKKISRVFFLHAHNFYRRKKTRPNFAVCGNWARLFGEGTGAPSQT